MSGINEIYKLPDIFEELLLALVGRMVAGPELKGSALPTLDTLPAAPAPGAVPQLVASDLELLLSYK